MYSIIIFLENSRKYNLVYSAWEWGEGMGVKIYKET